MANRIHPNQTAPHYQSDGYTLLAKAICLKTKQYDITFITMIEEDKNVKIKAFGLIEKQTFSGYWELLKEQYCLCFSIKHLCCEHSTH